MIQRDQLVLEYRRVTRWLAGVLLAGVLGLTAWGVIPLLLGPRGRYVDTLVLYAAGSVAEWVVRLEIGGELVEARFLSEREADALRDAMGGKR